MPRKKPSLAQFSWDATPERLAKAANDNEIVHDKEANGAPVQRRRVADWPLARLRSRGLLDADRRVNETLYEAGELFYAAWYCACLAPLGAIDYGKVRVDGVSGAGTNYVGLGSSDLKLAALQRHRRASVALGDLCSVVEAVVCHGRSVSDVIGSGGSAKRRGMADLKSGLAILAGHYGLAKPPYVVAA